MATPSKAPKFAVATDDDIPDEITADESQVNIGLSADELNTMPLDQEQHNADYKAMNPPTGDWLKADTWTLTKRVNADDKMPKDKDTVGRVYYTISGYPEPRVADGIEHKPMLFLRVSPDRRFKQDKVKEFDLAYKLWAKAVELHLSIKGTVAKTIGDVCGVLTEDEYIVRTMNGDSGAFPVDIKPKRQQR